MKRLLILSLILPFMCSCTSRSNQEQDKPLLGKYVYIDSDGILHTRNHCVLGMKTTDANGNERRKSVQFIEVSQLTQEDLQALCSWCVSDDQYEILKESAEEIIDWSPDEDYSQYIVEE